MLVYEAPLTRNEDMSYYEVPFSDGKVVGYIIFKNGVPTVELQMYDVLYNIRLSSYDFIVSTDKTTHILYMSMVWFFHDLGVDSSTIEQLESVLKNKSLSTNN